MNSIQISTAQSRLRGGSVSFSSLPRSFGSPPSGGVREARLPFITLSEFPEPPLSEARASSRMQPGVENHRIAGPFEQERFLEAPFHTNHNQQGPRLTMSGDESVHALALRRVPILPRCRRRKATFIGMDRPFATAKEPFPQAQEPFTLLKIASWYPSFFIGHLQSLERMPHTMPGDLEISRPFPLCPIRMDFYMRPQGFPIQLARPLWTKAFVHPYHRA